MLAQASRLQSSQRVFNVVVTNVPGPQFPLYMLGRKLLRIYPQVPLVRNTALGIAIMSYDGTLNFGLLGDYDALPDLDDLAAALRDAIAELAAAAGVARSRPRATRSEAVPRRAADPRALARDRDRGRDRCCSRATSGTSRRRAGPGEKVEARCPDEPAGVTRDGRPLSDDQIRQALSLGNVVLRYRGPKPPAALRELQDELTGPFDAEIAAAGQAVILARGGTPVRGAGLGPPPARQLAPTTRSCGRSRRRGSARARPKPLQSR